MVCFGILMVSPSLTVDFGGISASRLQPRRAGGANRWLHIQDCIHRRQAHGLLTELWFCAKIFQGCSNSFSQKMFRVWAHQMLHSWEQHGSESKTTGPTGRQELCCTHKAAGLLSRLSLCLSSKGTDWGQAELASLYKVCGNSINIMLWDVNSLPWPE